MQPAIGPVIIAASTLKGEEEPVLAAFRGSARAMPDRAARHRAAQARALRRSRSSWRARGGWPSRAAPSCAVDAEPRADVVVLDTIGELAQLFQVATVVFVGGSLVDAGRPQHPRAGRVRQADRVRSAHAELRRDRADVPGERRRDPGASPAASWSTALARPARRSGPARAPRRGRARARRGQSRRPRQDHGGDRRAAAAAGTRRRAPVPGGPADRRRRASRSGSDPGLRPAVDLLC